MKTIVLLDVDGVLLGMERNTQDVFISVGPVQVRKVVQVWLQSLSLQAEIFWATSWQSSAQIFEEILGFQAQGFLDFSNPRQKNYLWNKLEEIELFCQQHQECAFVLIDDNANKWLLTASKVLTELEKSGQLLVIKPNAYTGISDKEMKKITKYIEKKENKR